MRLSILISERMFSAFDIDRELTGVRAYKTVQNHLKSEKMNIFCIHVMVMGILAHGGTQNHIDPQNDKVSRIFFRGK